MDTSKYTYQVMWSEEDHEFVATAAEFSSLSWLDSGPQEAISGLAHLVSEVVSDMKDTGERIPIPLGSRNYSGQFNVRTSPSLHRKLSIEAQREGISLNALINQKLTSA